MFSRRRLQVAGAEQSSIETQRHNFVARQNNPNRRLDRSTLADKVEELDREIEASKSPLHLPPMPNSHASAPNPTKP
jgi:hypothetical protein